MTDEFTAAINRFCAGLSEKVAILAAEEGPGMRLLTETLLGCIREAQANLELCAIECEAMLRHE